MKLVITLLILSLSFSLSAQHEHHEAAKDSTSKAKPKSPRKVAMAMVGDNHVHIDYGSPSVRGRQIWNGLVAYSQVWATGAHKATWIEFSADTKINSQLIPKGKYGLFTIPDKKNWTIILSKDWDMHLADNYKIESDIIRIKVKAKKSKPLTEELTFLVQNKSNTKGQVSIIWEYVKVSFDFENSNK